MWIAETIDLDNHDSVIKFMRNQSDKIKKLEKENEQLRKELEDWKSNCLSTINENSILWNEIAIMREQGAKPSSAFEEYCSKFKGDVND